MTNNVKLDCAFCQIEKGSRACDSPDGAGPDGCPTLEGQDVVEAVMVRYRDADIAELARQASLQEAACYEPAGKALRTLKCRIEEVCEFARRMGCRKLGLAFCAGFIAEARALGQILCAQGFEVHSVVCKAGAVPKEEIGLADSEKIRPGTFETMCSPLAQAAFLNRAGTELNIVMGLCVGHDALLLANVEAPTTVLAVKDRLLGHNPLAALYTSGSYYKRLMQKP